MAARKKQEIEFRYYEVPEGEQVLALLGESWRRTYGDDVNSLHFHNLLEIGFCLEGNGHMVFDERTVSYAPGSLTVIPQNFPHVTNSWMGGLSYWEYLFLDPEAVLMLAYPEDGIFVRKLLDRINHNAVCFDAEENKELAVLVRLAMEECRKRKSYSVEVLRGLLLSILIVIARNDIEPGMGMEKYPHRGGLSQILEALDYIDKYYMEEIRVAELAGKCSLSETHFRRIFVEYMSMTPAEYLTLIRIQNACELIKKSRYSMEEVARRVGYPTVSTFNRNFRRIVGTSPYQYKKNRDNYEGKLLNFKVSAKRGW